MGSGRETLLKKTSLSFGGRKRARLGFRMALEAPAPANVRGTGAAAVLRLRAPRTRL